MKNTPLLEVDNVSQFYNNRRILENINFKINKGEFCTLVGPSGSGKTTLLQLIMGEQQAHTGNISMSGFPVKSPNIDRGIVFQSYALFPHLNVLENVMLGLNLQSRNNKVEHKLLLEKTFHYLSLVHLKDHAYKYPYELSGGMQQRAAIAQSLIIEPKILLMDEPFGALDPHIRDEMQVLILDLWEKNEMTVFFITHDLEEAIYLGTRVFVLSPYYQQKENKKSRNQGARILLDKKLSTHINSTEIKNSPDFFSMVSQIRNIGFNPKKTRLVDEFNTLHDQTK
ncbi:MAG: ABC transporter ATP-binding protein [Methylococcales bacterium]|jgi:NitT/TauT family transport system ATP-binding protein|nr:ABC transporter ATP-binding protein [Methylococcales bacterium]MBT7408542.1 ABC transporter ATP-binding protein [Methylococcales bacterium]